MNFSNFSLLISLLGRSNSDLNFYFCYSEENLIKDTYLRDQMDDQGFAPLHVIAGFRKVNFFIDVLSCLLVSFTFPWLWYLNSVSYFISKFITFGSPELILLVSNWGLGWTCIQSRKFLDTSSDCLYKAWPCMHILSENGICC